MIQILDISTAAGCWKAYNKSWKSSLLQAKQNTVYLKPNSYLHKFEYIKLELSTRRIMSSYSFGLFLRQNLLLFFHNAMISVYSLIQINISWILLK